MWIALSYLCWAGSAALVAWMIFDWFKTDSADTEETLTSSHEGEIEAAQEKHRV